MKTAIFFYHHHHHNHHNNHQIQLIMPCLVQVWTETRGHKYRQHYAKPSQGLCLPPTEEKKRENRVPGMPERHLDQLHGQTFEEYAQEVNMYLISVLGQYEGIPLRLKELPRAKPEGTPEGNGLGAVHICHQPQGGGGDVL